MKGKIHIGRCCCPQCYCERSDLYICDDLEDFDVEVVGKSFVVPRSTIEHTIKLTCKADSESEEITLDKLLCSEVDCKTYAGGETIGSCTVPQFVYGNDESCCATTCPGTGLDHSYSLPAINYSSGGPFIDYDEYVIEPEFEEWATMPQIIGPVQLQSTLASHFLIIRTPIVLRWDSNVSTGGTLTYGNNVGSVPYTETDTYEVRTTNTGRTNGNNTILVQFFMNGQEIYSEIDEYSVCSSQGMAAETYSTNSTWYIGGITGEFTY